MTEDRSKELLAAHMKQAAVLLDNFLDAHGENVTVLGKAMEDFTLAVFDLPKEAACKPGCAFCCHLSVGVSIPELLVIHEELLAQTTPEGLDYFRNTVFHTARICQNLDETSWYDVQPPCPFLDDQNGCLIYPIRPFSCRAHHSTDAGVCRQGYEEKKKVMVPCFPLYRATTDMYSSVFIRVMKDRGFPSFQVGLVKGLARLFEEPGLGASWLNREDVFSGARL